MTSNVTCNLSPIQQRLSHISKDVGSILPTVSKHRDDSSCRHWYVRKGSPLVPCIVCANSDGSGKTRHMCLSTSLFAKRKVQFNHGPKWQLIPILMQLFTFSLSNYTMFWTKGVTCIVLFTCSVNGTWNQERPLLWQVYINIESCLFCLRKAKPYYSPNISYAMWWLHCQWFWVLRY